MRVGLKTRWAALAVCLVACSSGEPTVQSLPRGTARGRFVDVTETRGVFEVECGIGESGGPIRAGRWIVRLAEATISVTSNPEDLARGDMREMAFDSMSVADRVRVLLDDDWVVTNGPTMVVSNGPTDLDC